METIKAIYYLRERCSYDLGVKKWKTEEMVAHIPPKEESNLEFCSTFVCLLLAGEQFVCLFDWYTTQSPFSTTKTFDSCLRFWSRCLDSRMYHSLNHWPYSLKFSRVLYSLLCFEFVSFSPAMLRLCFILCIGVRPSLCSEGITDEWGL